MKKEIFSPETSTVKTTTCTDKVGKELRTALQAVTQSISQNTNTGPETEESGLILKHQVHVRTNLD